MSKQREVPRFCTPVGFTQQLRMRELRLDVGRAHAEWVTAWYAHMRDIAKQAAMQGTEFGTFSTTVRGFVDSYGGHVPDPRTDEYPGWVGLCVALWEAFERHGLVELDGDPADATRRFRVRVVDFDETNEHDVCAVPDTGAVTVEQPRDGRGRFTRKTPARTVDHRTVPHGDRTDPHGTVTVTAVSSPAPPPCSPVSPSPHPSLSDPSIPPSLSPPSSTARDAHEPARAREAAAETTTKTTDGPSPREDELPSGITPEQLVNAEIQKLRGRMGVAAIDADAVAARWREWNPGKPPSAELREVWEQLDVLRRKFESDVFRSALAAYANSRKRVARLRSWLEATCRDTARERQHAENTAPLPPGGPVSVLEQARNRVWGQGVAS